MDYKQISYGSKGDDVKTLQEKLNSNGYSLAVDGVFGSKTQAALKDYQQKNKLTVDGIAGKETWGSLNGANSTTQNTSQNTQAASTSKPAASQQMQGYDAGSDAAYQQALAALQQAQQSMPSYQGTYDAQLEEIYNQIVNRPKFQYDLNGDALYQQYANQFQQKGQMAMMDTMGQAAAMTGGFGNSYAQMAGQQAYQGYLQQLNEVVPELYGMAQDQYNQEGQQLLNQYSMLGDMRDAEYGRYQDALNQYWQNVSFQDQQADEAYDRGYGEYMDKLNYEYQLGRDAVEDERYEKEFAYQQERDKVSDSQWEKQYAESVRQFDKSYQLSASKASGSSGGSGGGGGGDDDTGGAKYDNGKVSEENIKKIQERLGVTVDGKWGSQSSEAAGGMTADEAWAAFQSGEFDKVTEEDPYTMSDAAKEFMKKLPYAHAGSSAEAWKNVVEERLIGQYEKGILSKQDVEAIIYKLGLDK